MIDKETQTSQGTLDLVWVHSFISPVSLRFAVFFFFLTASVLLKEGKYNFSVEYVRQVTYDLASHCLGKEKI